MKQNPLRYGAGILAIGLALGAAPVTRAAEIEGSLTVNDKPRALTHVSAFEIDSLTEPGYLDVLVVFSDRAISREHALDPEKLQALSLDADTAAVRLLLDPDCRIKSVGHYHPASKLFLENAGDPQWEPSAYDLTVGGRLHSNGDQEEFGQRWSYDLRFEVPIDLDPEAIRVPDR